MAFKATLSKGKTIKTKIINPHVEDDCGYAGQSHIGTSSVSSHFVASSSITSSIPHAEQLRQQLSEGNKKVFVVQLEKSDSRDMLSCQLKKYKKKVIEYLRKSNINEADICDLINNLELKNAAENGYSAESFAQALLF